MKKTIYLHVGFHKTGTTSLQKSLKLHESDLARQNIDYITGTGDASHAIAWSLSRRTWGWKNQGGAKINLKVWNRAVKRIRSSRKNVLLSSEFFTEISEDQLFKIKESLKGNNVKIIFTWRPLNKLMISSYQQYLKYGIKSDLDEWLHSVLDNPPESKITPTFWKRHLHGDVINQWAKVFGVENISIIVVSDQNRDFIFKAFEECISLIPGTLSNNENDVLNRSLNTEEVALLLEINKRFPRDLGWDNYENSIRLGAIEKLSSEKPQNLDVPKLLLPNWSEKPIFDIEKIQNTKMLNSGCKIVGDFDGVNYSKAPFGVNELPISISLDSAAFAVIGAGKQSLKSWRIRQLAREIMIRIYRKLK